MDNSSNNKRIAKNTMMLYIRTFFVMLVSLYTSRIVLQVLGETDFGIYNVVGGIVVLFSFLNSAMSIATQRFLNFELGKNNLNEVRRIFSMSMTVHISIALIILLASETIGLWFLNTQMNIPQNRMVAAQWVYQFSVLGCCIQIIRIPYNASIIAYEKMSFYASVSIIEVSLNLLLIYLLTIITQDKLIVYSILIFTVSLIGNFIYKIYCNKNFITCRYNYFWDKPLYAKLMSFSGWSLFGSVANIGANQGINLLLNIFCGVVVNAAMGIATQVSSAVSAFVSNFQTAFVPQIVKSYAAGEKEYFMSLIFRTSRLSYFLILIFAIPMVICCEPILNIWLTHVPIYTVQFTQLTIAFCMIDAISGPLWNSVQATGKIRNYQILMSILIIANLPIAYGLLNMGISPIYVLLIRVIINFITHIVRIFYLNHHIDFPIMNYLKSVMMKCFMVTILSLPMVLIMYHSTTGFIGLAITLFFSLIQTSIIIFAIGLTTSERNMITSKFKQQFKIIDNNDRTL